MTIEELQVLITGETRGLRRSLDQVKKQLGQTDREVSKVTKSINSTLRTIGATLATLGIGAFFTSATRDAMQFEAAIQQINRLMGDSAQSFQNWANTQASAFGFARSEAIRYGAVYANLLSGFSAGTAETMQRTQDLLQASAVVASSTGRSMEDVMERIRSGLLGNTEAIEDLGINVNVALIESTEAFQRFANGKSWDQLDFNIQQTIRYFAILEQASTKYGLELAQNTATRQAMFVAQLKDTRLALGQAFLPIYNAVLPALTRMAAALANAARWLAAFMQALFGYNQSQQAPQTQAQAGAVSELGDAYEKAGKQAKGAVSGFDQINLVGGTTPDAAAGDSPLVPVTGTETGAITDMSTAMDGVSQKAQETADKVRRMADRVKAAFGEMSSFMRRHSDLIIAALGGVGAAIGAAFLITKWGAISAGVTKAITTIRTALSAIIPILAGISWPITLIVTAVGALTAAFIYFYRTNEKFRGTVDGIFQSIGDAAKWVWNEVLVPFGGWLMDGLVAAWHAVGEGAKWLWENVLKPFGAWLADVMPIAWEKVKNAAMWLWKNVFVPLGDFLKWLWREVLEPVAGILRDVLAIAFDKVAEIAKSFWQDVLVPLGKALSEMLEPAIEAVSAVLTWLWEKALKPLGRGVKTEIMPIVAGLIDILEWLWKNILKPLVNFIGDVVVAVFKNAFRSIGDVIGGVKNIFVGLMNFITGVFTGDWKKAWEGVKKIFKGVFDALWGIVKFPLNLIIDGINALISGINKFSIDIPDWVADLAGAKGGKFGFNIPKIPKLDVGTNYVPRDMLAYIHEGEAVVPKEYNPAAGGRAPAVDNREVVSVLRSILRAIQQSGDRPVNLNLTELSRNVTRGQNDLNRRAGRTLGLT